MAKPVLEKNRLKQKSLSVALAMALMPLSYTAAAQTDASDEQREPRDVETVVVIGEIAYRNRTTDTEPVLSYDLEYFQRFEPSTVGDMVKRVPGAVFVSDVLEYDGVQLRGLDPSYTQVLINGKKVPGSGDDRSFWVDRIPAEMVERVEILRSNSANRSGDAVAGALNIVLRDSYEFDGSYVRLGAQHYDDGEIKPTVGLVTSGEMFGGRVLLGLNMQDRYNPKLKRSDRFNDPVEMELESFEDQADTRDGQDYSGNLSYSVDLNSDSSFAINGFMVQTDREQIEVSKEVEYDDGDTIVADVPGRADIDQKNWGIGFEFDTWMAGGETEFSFDIASFEDTSSESEDEVKYENGEWDETEGEAESIDAEDTESSFKIAHTRDIGDIEMEFGLDYRKKERDVTYTFLEFEAEEENDPIVYELDGTVSSAIEETRLDPYLMFSGTSGILEWEAGVRYETTESDISSTQDDDPSLVATKDYNEVLPSLHLKWDLTDEARINFSMARSLRRPSFNHINPALLDEEYGDNDFLGNPDLEPEIANGFDLGFEYRLGTSGVVGINFFYRDVEDLIELISTGEPNETAYDDYADDIEDLMEDESLTEEEAMALEPFDPDSFIYTMDNVGDGTVKGIEFDISTPLSALGLDNTGVFANYSYLDSEVEDFIGKRRFNNQAKSVYNVGFIQNLPDAGASFGLSYREQGDAYERILGEEVTVSYGEDLELFVEKRIGENISVRFSGTNLLDAHKDEEFHKFDTESDQLDRDYDEYELETEWAGPRYQLVFRMSF